jgi:hypothetical protein
MVCPPRLAALALPLLLMGGAVWAQAPSAEAPLEVEAWDEPSAAAPDAPAVAARVYGTLRTRAGVDTSFDSPRGDPLGENVFDLGARLTLGMDAELSAHVRAVVEGWAFWRGTAQRGLQRQKAVFEPELGEAYVDLYTPKVDVRLGNQVVAFGANPAFAPADQLNPRDLRESYLLSEWADGKLPNLAARARGTWGKVDWTAAYFPFFRPNRFTLTGQDEALLQPALGLWVPLTPDPSIEDGLQPHLLETTRPNALPWNGDLGLRATTRAAATRLGLSWIWIHEKTPTVELDPELAALVRARARGVEPEPSLWVSLQERAAAGQALWSGRYHRQHVLSAEAQRLVGGAQLDVDVSWSPAQTLLGSDLQPLRKQTFSAVVGLSQASESRFFYNLTWLALAVPELPSDGYLFLLEPATAAGAPRTVWFHALAAMASWRLLDERLTLSVRAAVEPVQRSWVLAPKVAWKGPGRVTAALGAELYGGRPWSPFGYYGRNDQVVGLLSVDLF